ncbi:MAG: DUF3800 domain-containing protein [Atopobiaceae bacterium]|nr:DUF3800 domain-containing protein [Atopobiaceae bacterium]
MVAGPGRNAAERRLFRERDKVNLFVFGDESGVFDRVHNDLFVFGGLVFLDKESKDLAYRKYIAAEKAIAPLYGVSGNQRGELKACKISNKHKSGLFRSTNGMIRYGFVVNQRNVVARVFDNKKSKQRYLDYVFKVGLRRVCESLIEEGAIHRDEIENIHIRFDEHTTATDGIYELREGIEEEFKHGTVNYRYNKYYEPVFPAMSGGITLDFRDSRNDALIRASDIIANHAFYLARNDRFEEMGKKMRVVLFPESRMMK